MKRFKLQELQRMPTLCVGQTCDLKYEGHGVRVWLSRCGVEDGEPYENKVTVEKWFHVQWRVVDEYQAEDEYITHKLPS